MANYMYVASDLADAKRVADEYAYIGRYATIDEEALTVTLHALPPKKEKKKKDDRNNKNPRERDSREDTESDSRGTANERNPRRSNGYTRGKFVEGTD